jgi:hypothetical protein
MRAFGLLSREEGGTTFSSLQAIIYESAAWVKRILRRVLNRFCHNFRDLSTLRTDQPEDRATLESDPSAELVAGMARGVSGFIGSPPIRR